MLSSIMKKGALETGELDPHARKSIHASEVNWWINLDAVLVFDTWCFKKYIYLISLFFLIILQYFWVF